MSDVPQKLKPPTTQSSLAEMAAKAAQRTQSNRPPVVDAGGGASLLISTGDDAPSRLVIPPSQVPPPPPRVPLSPAQAYAPPVVRPSQQPISHLPSASASPSLTPVHTMSAPPTVASSPAIAPSAEPKRRNPMVVALLVAVVGIGGAYVAGQQGLGPLAATKSAHASPEPVAAAASPAEEKTAPAKEQPAVAAPIAAAVDPASLPVEPAAPAINAPGTDINLDSKSRAAAPRPASRPTPAAVAAPVAAPSPAPAPKQAEPVTALPAAPSTPEPGGLSGAIKKAAGPAETHTAQAILPDAPVARSNGNIPEVPASGAIQGAIGSQRGAARACVSGQEGASRANITFASTGKVQSVSVSGPAAGTPAEACIRNAFSKASVGPFSKPTFSFATTITPP